jgi:hypothetical protein
VDTTTSRPCLTRRLTVKPPAGTSPAGHHANVTRQDTHAERVNVYNETTTTVAKPDCRPDVGADRTRQ